MTLGLGKQSHLLHIIRSWTWRRPGLHLPNGSVWFAPICGDPGSDENAQELSPDFALICFIGEATFGWGAGMRELEKKLLNKFEKVWHGVGKEGDHREFLEISENLRMVSRPETTAELVFWKKVSLLVLNTSLA